jgi:hypothetical protein
MSNLHSATELPSRDAFAESPSKRAPRRPSRCAFRGGFAAGDRERLRRRVCTSEAWAFLRFRVTYHGCRLWGVRLSDGRTVCAPTMDQLAGQVQCTRAKADMAK